MIFEFIEIRFAVVMLLGALMAAYFYFAPDTETFLFDGQIVTVDERMAGSPLRTRWVFDKPNRLLGDFKVFEMDRDRMVVRPTLKQKCVLKADGTGTCVFDSPYKDFPFKDFSFEWSVGR
ncbi:hypothetical protein ACFQ14_13785 [Pseudahrensia aquimaris]|uniref:Uncharacterized protein n=1 Tax=Pseudahrensia aquimaris TaxID=744461 RepID=A0ABW3FG56_9HYPH